MEVSRIDTAKLKALEYATKKGIVNQDVIESYVEGYKEGTRNPLKVTEMLQKIIDNTSLDSCYTKEQRDFYDAVVKAIEYGKKRGV